jgi:membrane associated rhomboid family serine protease
MASYGVWMLSVPDTFVPAALSELEAYRRENRHAAAAPPRPEPSFPGAWPSVAAYAGLMIALAGFARELSFGFDWLSIGRMDGARLAAGEWWRVVTALTLHRDLDHLLGNVAFGAFFAYFVCRYWGSGLGWLGIVLAGAVGNLVNGFVAGPDHLSIGASTAVFGALGILTAHTWRRGFPARATRRERIAPIVAGLGLLAFTGTAGENTDLGAHLFGFAAGFVLAAYVARLEIPSSPALQRAFAAAAWLLVAGAWCSGLAARGL